MMTLLLLLFMSFNPLHAMDNQRVLTNKQEGKEKKALTCKQMYDLLTQWKQASTQQEINTIIPQLPESIAYSAPDDLNPEDKIINWLTILNKECTNYLYEVMDPKDMPFPLDSWQISQIKHIDSCPSCQKWITSKYDPKTIKGVLEDWPVICGTCRKIPPLRVEYRKSNFIKKYGIDVLDFKVGTNPKLYVQRCLYNQEDI